MKGIRGIGAEGSAAQEADDAVAFAGGRPAARRGDTHGGRNGDTNSHEGHDAGQVRAHAVQKDLR